MVPCATIWVATLVATLPQDSKGTAPAAAPRAGKLVVSLAAEESVAFRMRNEITSEVSLQGMKLGSTTVIEQEAEIALVEPLAGGGAVFAVHLGPMKGTIEMPMLGKIEFDSMNESEGLDANMAAAVRMLTRLADVDVTARVSADGVVQEVEGDEDLFKDVAVPPMMQKLGVSTSSSDLRPQVQALFARIPPGEIGTAASFAMEVPMNVKSAEISFHLDGEVEARAADRVTWSLRTPAPAGESGADGAERHWSSSSQEVTEAALEIHSTVSTADGLPLQQTTVLQVTLELPNPLGGAALPTRNTTRLTLERVAAGK